MSDNLNKLRRREQDSSSGPDREPIKNKFRSSTFAGSLPWLLLAAFVLLALWMFGDRFETGRQVDLVKVVTLRAQQARGSPQMERSSESPVELSFDGPTLFQASGWVEPDPLLIRATALYSGVVERVHVLEGERVESGQLLATMVSEDAELDLQAARADLSEARAALQQAQARMRASEALLDSKRREVSAAQARLRELEDESDRLSMAGKEVFRESQIRQASLRVESQQAVVEAGQSKVEEAAAERDRGHAGVALAEAKLARAQAEVARRELALERTRIYSPVDGRIQQLFAAPGKKRMLGMDHLESATIATLYQPDKLQARIDVPLNEAAQLAIGQLVRLRSTLLPDRVFEGRVTRIDGEADLQRNTLQAKVQILNPVDVLRPEMLCRAEFLALPRSRQVGVGDASAQSGRVALYLPESALLGSGDDGKVWALDASGTKVEQRNLRLGQDRRDGHIEVLEGLRPGDWIVNDPPPDLKDGERVRKVEP